jgi:DNA-binding transcriptional LysR family regulator
MELRQLTYFVAVAEERQFTRASERVSVAQPAVSTQIRQLERELGESLFHRGQRQAALTEAGQAFLPYARAALEAARGGREAVAALHGLRSGRLRLGVSGPLDDQLAEVLGRFHHTYPGVEIVLHEQHNEPLIQAVVDSEVEVASVGLTGAPLPPQLAVRLFSVEPLVAVVARDSGLGRRTTITLAELAQRPMLALARGSGLRAVLENACGQAGLAPRIVAETGELGSLAELAAQGLGVAILPRSAAARAGITVLRIIRPRLQRRTALAWNQGGTGPAGRAFLALVVECLPAVPARGSRA